MVRFEDYMSKEKRVPGHLGVIPDGNRRWARKNGVDVGKAYGKAVERAVEILTYSMECGVNEVTAYGFLPYSREREPHEVESYSKSIVNLVDRLNDIDGLSLNIVGKRDSEIFPKKLRKYVNRRHSKNASMRLNLLVNYDYKWDLGRVGLRHRMHSYRIPEIDLIVRWGGRSRLSGFLPYQSAYAYLHVFERLWPDAVKEDLDDSFRWYVEQAKG